MNTSRYLFLYSNTFAVFVSSNFSSSSSLKYNREEVLTCCNSYVSYKYRDQLHAVHLRIHLASWITFSRVAHLKLNTCCGVFVSASFCTKQKVVVKTGVALELSQTGYFWVPLCLCFKTSPRKTCENKFDLQENKLTGKLILISLISHKLVATQRQKAIRNGTFTNRIP